MRKTQYVVIEENKKRSPVKIIFTVASVILAIAAVCAVVYKYMESKYRSRILGRVDLDGDGEAEAIMLDTTGNGEIDTIIIDAPTDEVEEKE